MELRDRLDAFSGGAAGDLRATGDHGLVADLEGGLANRFKTKDISRAVEKVVAAQPEADLGELLAAAIAEMTGGKR